jgi:hypothetical protein
MQEEYKTPPRNLGCSRDDLERAQRHNLLVRYWPLREAPCTPTVGWVREVGTKPYSRTGWNVVAWLSSKSGFVCATHCEVIEDIEE